MMLNFYVYELIDPRNDSVFYIGKGHDGRMYDHEKLIRRGKIPNKNYELRDKILEILSEGNEVQYHQVYWTNNEQDAYKKEKERVNFYGLENLCNITPGGDGGVGNIPKSKEHKRKMSEFRKGKTYEELFGKKKSDEIKRKMGELRKGKTYEEIYGFERAEEIKKKNSNSQKGKHYTEETKRKISEINKGKHPTEKTRKKLSEVRKGKTYEQIYGEKRAGEEKKKRSESHKGKQKPPRTEEHRKNLSLALKGKKKPPFSEEHRKKLDEARKGKTYKGTPKLEEYNQ